MAASGQGIQMLTMKLDGGSGATLWTDIRGGSAGADDLAWDIVVGPDGNPVISGHVVDAGGVTSCLTCKLSATDGALVWAATTVGALNDAVSRSSWLGVADDGDILMVQRGYGATSGYDVVVARYASGDGHTVWNARYDGPTHGGDDPRAMTVTTDGDVVVAGVQDTWWNYNFMTLRFSGATGAVLWQAPAYDGPPGWYDVATAVAEGPGGLIVTTGLSDGTGTSWDIATIGYDGGSGLQQWVLRRDGPASQSDEPRAVSVGAGRVFVTGYTYAATTGKDWITLAYDLGLLSPVPAPTARTAAVLAAPWPNPFNPRTTIAFDLARPADVRVAVHALDGALVRTLYDGGAPSGCTAVTWDGRDAQGRPAAAGTYAVRLISGGTDDLRLVTLVK